jgi:predicted transcriptional regulator
MSRRILTADERSRVVVLRTEGLPARWIAEDVGTTENTVTNICHARPEEVAEWRTVFQQIRRDPELFALHTEIAPKRKRGATR